MLPVFSRSILERRKEDVFPVSFFSVEREGKDNHRPEMYLTLKLSIAAGGRKRKIQATVETISMRSQYNRDL